MDSDGYTTIRMYLIPLTEYSTDGKMVNFIFHIFYQNENESTIYSVLAHTHTHGWSSDALSNVQIFETFINEISWTQKTTSTRFHLHELSVSSKFIEAPSGWKVTEGWEQGRWGALASWDRVSVWGDGKVLEVDSSRWLHNSVINATEWHNLEQWKWQITYIYLSPPKWTSKQNHKWLKAEITDRWNKG